MFYSPLRRTTISVLISSVTEYQIIRDGWIQPALPPHTALGLERRYDHHHSPDPRQPAQAFCSSAPSSCRWRLSTTRLKAKVAFIISLLQGRALNWGPPWLPTTPSFIISGRCSTCPMGTPRSRCGCFVSFRAPCPSMSSLSDFAHWPRRESSARGLNKLSGYTLPVTTTLSGSNKVANRRE